MPGWRSSPAPDGSNTIPNGVVGNRDLIPHVTVVRDAMRCRLGTWTGFPSDFGMDVTVSVTADRTFETGKPRHADVRRSGRVRNGRGCSSRLA